MKKFIITFLGIFLLSATMNAAADSAITNSGTYCVELPGHDVGDSGWTKRDNHIGARWKFAVPEGKFFGKTYSASYATFRGHWEGQTVPNRYLYGIDHLWYSRGDRPLCVNYARLKKDLAVYYKGTQYSGADVWLWLDVKYGDDCPKIDAFWRPRFHTRMEIVKKSGDLVNPWYCRWKNVEDALDTARNRRRDK